MPLEEKLRTGASEQVSLLETVLYLCVALLLCIAAALGLFGAATALWQGFTAGNNGVFALDQMLLVLMLIEILHTVRISIKTHTLTVVPFLIVGLIATIRRILVIGMQASRLADNNGVAFRNSMIEEALLAVLILVFVFSIYYLGKSPPQDDLVKTE